MAEGSNTLESKVSDHSEVDARRKFLRNCAKFASGAPPAVALLLSSSPSAIAQDPDPPNCNYNGIPLGPPCSPPVGEEETTTEEGSTP